MDQMNGLESFDRESVDRFTRDWEAVFDRGHSGTMAAFYAEDAKLIATQTETVEGRAAIERFWRASCERAKALSMKRTVHVEHVERAGALGYARGTVVVQIGDAPAKTTVRYITLWKQEADSVWRCIVDISSAAPPA